MKYRCNDIFMIRTPTLPIERYLELLEYDNFKEDISKFINYSDMHGFLNESLLVSSKSLQRTFTQEKKTIKKKKLIILVY